MVHTNASSPSDDDGPNSLRKENETISIEELDLGTSSSSTSNQDSTSKDHTSRYNNDHADDGQDHDYDDNNMHNVPTPFRVLCLHDAASNAGELSEKLHDLGQRLYDNHAIELVFINSPLLMSTGTSSTPTTTSTTSDDSGNQASLSETINGEDLNNQKKNQKVEDSTDDENTIDNKHGRVWWEEKSLDPSTGATTAVGENAESDDDDDDDHDDDDNDIDIDDTTKHSTPTKQYVGLDASLLLLRQIWTSQPFWGILAVGQGASVASLLALLPDMINHRPSFCIFVEGVTLLDDEEPLLLNDEQDQNGTMSCLHILGVHPKDTTKRLVQQFGGEVSSGISPFSNVSKNRIGKFLVSKKKRLRHDPSNATILALQNQLFWAEQQAAHLVAKEIADNPPKPLMAVISPKEVGGFSGTKRRGPGEEGGGAPCPSEFLLQREKRTTNPDGPTRHHPSQS